MVGRAKIQPQILIPGRVSWDLKVNGSTIFFDSMMNIQCQKSSIDRTFYQVTDLNLTIDLYFDLYVGENATLFLDLYKPFELKINEHENDGEGVTVNLFDTTVALRVLEPLITTAINKLTEGGISINEILEKKFPHFNLTELTIQVDDGLFDIHFTPQFHNTPPNSTNETNLDFATDAAFSLLSSEIT